MKDTLRYGFILSLICIIASGLLAGVNFLTRPKILAQDKAKEEAGLKELFPKDSQFEAVESEAEIIYYKAYNKTGQFLGVAFKTLARGYTGEIETIVAMDKDAKILGIKVINQNETPGLGSRIAEVSFTHKFFNRDVSQLEKVEAITGATISSRAVIDAIKKRSEEIKTLIKNEE